MSDSETEDLPDRAQAVAVAYVHSAEVSYSWYHSMMRMIGWDIAHQGRVIQGGYIAIRCGTDGLVESRNNAVREFLADGAADWLLWIDTDMGFDEDTIDRLMEVANPVTHPVVGALCFAQREHQADGRGGWRCSAVPTIYDWAHLGEEQGFAVRWDYPANQVTRCNGTGSACILIHRSVFERIAAAYGPNWYTRTPNPTTGQVISEDLSFCVRAGALEIPIHVHTGVATTHHKQLWLAEEDYWQQRAVSPPPPAPAGLRVNTDA